MATTEKPADVPELQPAREHRLLPLDHVEWRASGAGEGELILRGHASVYNRLSLDLGGFRERIAPGAFARVLDRNPDVHALWDHDTKRVLARTKNKTLDLRDDPVGLHFYAKVADTSYARDLRVLMERGDVDQASFAFTVERDEWTIDENEEVTRTIHEVRDLYDVTVTAQGAYPHTDSKVFRHIRSLITEEIAEGRLPETAADALPETVAPDTVGKPDPQAESLESGKERNPAPETVGDDSTRDAVEEKRAEELRQLQRDSHAEVELAKRRLLDAERERKRNEAHHPG
jgi:HK97 family phage prohead protease